MAGKKPSPVKAYKIGFAHDNWTGDEMGVTKAENALAAIEKARDYYLKNDWGDGGKVCFFAVNTKNSKDRAEMWFELPNRLQREIMEMEQKGKCLGCHEGKYRTTKLFVRDNQYFQANIPEGPHGKCEDIEEGVFDIPPQEARCVLFAMGQDAEEVADNTGCARGRILGRNKGFFKEELVAVLTTEDGKSEYYRMDLRNPPPRSTPEDDDLDADDPDEEDRKDGWFLYDCPDVEHVSRDLAQELVKQWKKFESSIKTQSSPTYQRE